MKTHDITFSRSPVPHRDPHGDRWLPGAEITQHLGLSRGRGYTWLRERERLSYTIGCFWKLDEKEVDE
jgi:hypothetical protein